MSDAVDDTLSLDELADQTGVLAELIEKWQSLGLVQTDRQGRFGLEAAERVRLLRFTSDRGVTAANIATLLAARGDDVLGRYIDLLGGGRRVVGGIADTAERLGLAPSLLRRMWTAGGFGAQTEVFEEDIDAIRAFRTALDAGLPPEAVIQMVRVLGDALGRVADTESRLFHFYVHEQLRAEGLSDREAFESSEAVIPLLLGLVEPIILYFHQKSWHRALSDDLLMHLSEDLGPSDGPIGQLPIAVLFVDLAGFTVLTETMGDVAAAEVVDRFSDLVRDAAAECDGRVLKQIGDEFMVVFPHGRAAVRGGLRIAEHVAAEPLFPGIRMGTHLGTALFRDADYLGSAVNIAGRVVAEASRGQFLVTPAVRDDALSMGWVSFESIGQRAFKGVAEPLELFQVKVAGEAKIRRVDPVCGMELDPDAAVVRLSEGEGEVSFCSQSCLEQFKAAPDRYRAR